MAILTFSNRGDIVLPDEYKDSENLLLCLMKSLFDVSKGYIWYHKSDDDSDYPQTERVFAYEFYRRWTENLKEDKIDDYIVNGEPEKKTSNFRNGRSNFPDLVLHHSQGDITRQGIVCEIKRGEGLTNINFRNDIEKLSYFVDEDRCDYCFQFGVFVLVGSDMGEVLSSIKKIDGGLLRFSEKFGYCNKLICITYDGTVLETVQLSEVLSYTSKEIDNIIKKYK